MGFKLGSINNKAVLISNDNYFDIETISNGEVSSISIEALESYKKLTNLYSKIDEFEPTGNINDVSFRSSCYTKKCFCYWFELQGSCRRIKYGDT
jgi:hypothetical protein